MARRPREVPADPTAANVDVVAAVRQTFGVWDDVRHTAAVDATAREEVHLNGTETELDDDDADSQRMHGEDERVGHDIDDMRNECDTEESEDILWGDADAMDQATTEEMDRIQEIARVPLYDGSPITSLEAVILMLNHHRANNATNVQTDQAFALAHRVLLPQPNTLPDSEYAASQMLRKLGLEFECIDVCPNNCVLFRGVFRDHQLCPSCGCMRRRKHGRSWVAQKVLRHFPLPARLKRMFRSPLQATTMTWIARDRREDGLVRHVSQSKHMADIREKEPTFCEDPRRLFLALSTDGMNPFSEKRSVYSTWPVTLMNYNIPPWMTTKRYFIMLSLLIPGPKAPSGDDFDTLIEPLVEELEILWYDGIMMQDAARFRNEHLFLMKVMLIFCIHDFPAYGMVAGCVTKGYHGCPVCGPFTVSRRSEFLKKNVYDDQARMHLPEDHEMRGNTQDFRGHVEFRAAPPRITAMEVVAFADERQRWLDGGGVLGAPGDPVHYSGIKRRSILYRLPYWEVCSHENFTCIITFRNSFPHSHHC